MAAADQLFCGDNLAVLREHISTASVDLVYLDPPFNSGRTYRLKAGRADAFTDTWRWSEQAEADYAELLVADIPGLRHDVLPAFRALLGESDALAYLVWMAPRLAELRRVTAPTGSVFLHCDPAMSHYLKALMDAVFGADSFRNEIIWHHQLGAMAGTRQLPSKHDVILFYSRGPSWTFHKVRGPVTAQMERKYCHEDDAGRFMMSYGRKYYLKGGKPLDDVWDIPALAPTSAERLGYPTQKPVRLLERILDVASDEGDLMLDPCCGAGTSVAAAAGMGRRWQAIDVNPVAISMVEQRLAALETVG